jgi:hypothetical protein
MFIAKYFDTKGEPVFAEVVRIGRVQFDPRPGWVLLATPLHIKEHKRDRRWVEPGFRFEWIRQFNHQGEHHEACASHDSTPAVVCANAFHEDQGSVGPCEPG